MKKKNELYRCESCINAKSLIINDDFLCNKHGIVDKHYFCKNYIKNTQLSCSNCTHFKMNENEKSTQGFCSIFTVRQFDGDKHKICAKYTRTSVLST